MTPGRTHPAMGFMLSRLLDATFWRTAPAILGIAAVAIGLLLFKNLPAFWAMVNADKDKRYRVCLEVIRLRRKDAPELPSYLEEDASDPKDQPQDAGRTAGAASA